MNDLTKIRAFAQGILDELGPAVIPPPPPSAILSTPEAFDRALSLASVGDVLTVATTLVYPAPLALRTKVLVRSAADVTGRMTLDAPAPRFLGGVSIVGDGVALRSLDVTNARTPHTDIVTISGKDVWVDQCRILGDPLLGAKRGIAANGGGSVAIVRCYIDDCFQSYPGDDSQAICAWDMLPGLLIEDCYLAGGSETVMIGGADSSTEARMPRDVVIRKNVITKNPAWKALPIGCKNILELKAVKNCTVEDNDLSYSWGGHGQDAFALMLTVRNQGGKAPWSTIQDVLIAGNRFAHSGAAINILGRDDLKPSDPMARVQILENTFDDLDPINYTAVPTKPGSKRMILIDGAPSDVAIRGNRFAGVGMTSVVYFATAGGPLCQNLNIDGNIWPRTPYAVFGSGATVGHAWDRFVASGTLGPNTEI